MLCRPGGRPRHFRVLLQLPGGGGLPPVQGQRLPQAVQQSWSEEGAAIIGDPACRARWGHQHVMPPCLVPPPAPPLQASTPPPSQPSAPARASESPAGLEPTPCSHRWAGGRWGLHDQACLPGCLAWLADQASWQCGCGRGLHGMLPLPARPHLAHLGCPAGLACSALPLQHFEAANLDPTNNQWNKVGGWCVQFPPVLPCGCAVKLLPAACLPANPLCLFVFPIACLPCGNRCTTRALRRAAPPTLSWWQSSVSTSLLPPAAWLCRCLQLH